MQIIYQKNNEKMKNFLQAEHVGVYELPILKMECEKRFGWNYMAWYRRETGATPLQETERMALRVILSEIRQRRITEQLDADYKAALIEENYIQHFDND